MTHRQIAIIRTLADPVSRQTTGLGPADCAAIDALRDEWDMLRDALCDLMDAVDDMPTDAAEVWPEAWAKATAALRRTHEGEPAEPEG